MQWPTRLEELLQLPFSANDCLPSHICCRWWGKVESTEKKLASLRETAHASRYICAKWPRFAPIYFRGQEDLVRHKQYAGFYDKCACVNGGQVFLANRKWPGYKATFFVCVLLFQAAILNLPHLCNYMKFLLTLLIVCGVPTNTCIYTSLLTANYVPLNVV